MTAMHTDAAGLMAGYIQIPTKDGEIPAYRAMPSDSKSVPVMLVIQEIFGVNEHMRDVCRRFAKLGYMAIAPEMFARQGDVSKMTDHQEIRNVVSRVPDAQVMSDLDAAVYWAADEGGDTGRLGICGFCWGGRTVWLYAAYSKMLKAGAAWYGQLEGLKNAVRTRTALEVAPEVKAPVIGLYGGQDEGIPLDQVEKMQDALHQTNTKSTIIVFPDAPHAFFADYRPNYRESDAIDAWAHMLAWFRKHGVA